MLVSARYAPDPMDFEFEVREVPAWWAAFKLATCRHEEIGTTITSPSVLGDVYRHCGRHGAGGPPFCRILDWRDSDCDLQAGAQISGPIPAEGAVGVEEIPASLCLSGTFIGPYSRLREIHAAARAYVADNGLDYDGPRWEVFDGPPGPDGTATTRIYIPVASSR